MNKKLRYILVMALIYALIGGCGESLVPVGDRSRDSSSQNELPDGSVVTTVDDAENIHDPFSLSTDVAINAGSCLRIPEGAETESNAGKARFTVDVPDDGVYYGWMRVRWNDSCGNSISLQVGDQPAQLVGEDNIFTTWHWVPTGRFQLTEGSHPVTLIEREDGVAVHQILFSPDKDYRPVGPLGEEENDQALRRFADDFSRSPGHGMEGWDIRDGDWEIAFSFDPNRVPNQYSLRGQPDEQTGEEGRAFIDGPPWRGARITSSIQPQSDSRFGLILSGNRNEKDLRLELETTADGARIRADGPETSEQDELGDVLRADQWHKLTVERWAWTMRVLIDGREVLTCNDITPSVNNIGLFVSSGTAFFDDLSVSEIPWQAEDGDELNIAWHAISDSQWFRPDQTSPDCALVGKSGDIVPRTPETVRELRLWQSESTDPCDIQSTRMKRIQPSGQPVIFRQTNQDGQPDSDEPPFTISAPATGTTRLERIAFRTDSPRPQFHTIGPYHFTKSSIEDPSDYLDFTQEEYEQIKESDDTEKLRRKPKRRPLIGKRGNKCVWKIKRDQWSIADGVLTGEGPEARLRHWQNIISPMHVTFRIRLHQPDASAHLQLYSHPGPGTTVRLARPEAASSDAKDRLSVSVPDDFQWHDVRIETDDNTLRVQLDDQEKQSVDLKQEVGGRIHLGVESGKADFDDVEFRVRRRTSRSSFYGFNKRETDWWRTGEQWIDHGGLACILASNWVTLQAPDSEGMLWNKRDLGPDMQVTFNVEENSEWFGWDQKPTHRHHPFDNIRVALSPRSEIDAGYCAELNADERSYTVLYRKGEEVERVEQDEDFPMRHTGGHSPYSPRKNRISLVKNDDSVRLIVNGQRVLQYTDPAPLPATHAGLGGHETRVNFSHIEVQSLTD